MTRSIKNPRGFWPEKKKIEVVTTYLALGKVPLVEGITGVPRATIRIWKIQPWWKELENDIRREETQELDAKLSKIVNKSLDVVADRLENGDFILNSKTGKISRVPTRIRDAVQTATSLLDKRQLIRKNPEEKTQHQQQFEDRLLKLAEQFATFALGKKPNEEKVIEGEIIDAIHDERAAGLQEGTFLGAQEETEPGQGSGSEESSEINDDIESGENCLEGEGCGPQESHIKGWTLYDVQPDGSR